MPEDNGGPSGSDFLRRFIREDLESGRFGGRVRTRFPPEPNGYLHIGHAKAALLNYNLAQEFGGKFNLRLDDTNPTKEEAEYVEAIHADLRWLGIDWEDREYYASDYFKQLYDWAVELIKNGLAYVDSSSPEEISRMRGTAKVGERSETPPGVESPYRGRSVEENLDLFERMRRGEFKEGECVLRAKIDMAHPNLNMRDPVMYRVMHAEHHRTGGEWKIYPTYDWAHGQSDSIEGITHSICTLEFENHRPLYDWYLDALCVHHPRQIEFARLNLTYTMMSKRLLLELVRESLVSGWDDPRMPTLAGLRRRGVPPEAIRDFCRRISVSKAESVIDVSLLENAVRDHLNRVAPRAMGVLDPVRLVIENYAEEVTESFDLPVNPEDESAGMRKVAFSRELFIEQDDFMEDPPKRFFRLAPGREVRLRGAYFVTCIGFEKDAGGRVSLIRATYDPATKGGQSPDGRKVKGTIHWVSAPHAVDAQVRLYDRLFTEPSPGKEWRASLNPDSLRVVRAKIEPELDTLPAGSRVQLERLGYFVMDPDAAPGRPVLNRIVSLKDSWAKLAR